jgi:hypothetical protein
MTPSLLPASSILPGDLLESPGDQVWRPVLAVEVVYGRLYFLMGAISRTALASEWVLVGRGEE